MTYSANLGLLSGALLGSLVMIACGSSDKTRNAVAATDASADAGTMSSGSGGASGKGGTGGSGGSGGNKGTGGATGGVAGAAAGGTDAGADSSVPTIPDATVPESSTPSEAGVLSCAGEAGTVWRDFAAGTCRACPGTTPRCNDVGTSFDAKTRIFVVQIPAGFDEIRSAGFVFRYYGEYSDGGPAPSYLNNGAPVPGVVKGNTLTFDLSTATPPILTRIEEGRIDVTDACGGTSSIDSQGLAFDIQIFTTDAGVVTTSVSCYSNT